MRIKIVTTDSKLSEIKLPINIKELTSVAYTSSDTLLAQEENLIANWIINNTIKGIECEVSNERLQAVINGSRTTTNEDKILCKYVLRVWHEIESIRKIIEE
jgi:hypothetical protein